MPTRFTAVSLLALTALMSSVESGGNAIANGESRTISIYHTHTGESLTIEYKRNGSFDRDALEKLNWLLRDWRRDEPTSMDPRLFDIVWEAQRSVGSTEPINVVSAYRSPETNAMLRRQSKAVAKNSQHMLGKAMDFYLTDANITEIREVGLRMQRGGVGYYPNAYTPFVHLDAGSVRHWPRMSHDELARLFPDGKQFIFLPTDIRLNAMPKQSKKFLPMAVRCSGHHSPMPAMSRSPQSRKVFGPFYLAAAIPRMMRAKP